LRYAGEVILIPKRLNKMESPEEITRPLIKTSLSKYLSHQYGCAIEWMITRLNIAGLDPYELKAVLLSVRRVIDDKRLSELFNICEKSNFTFECFGREI